MKIGDFCIQMLILMGVGAFSCRIGIADKSFSQKFSELLVNILIPCMAFSVMVQNYSGDKLGSGISMMLGCVGVIFIGMLAAVAVKKLRHKQDGLSYILVPSVMFMNANIIGFPVLQALYGEESLVYANFFMIPYRPLFYTLMPMLMKNLSADSPREIASSALKALNCPSVYASFLGLFVAVLGIKMPTVLLNTIDMIGDTAIPFGMLLCGIYIGGVNFKSSLLRFDGWMAVLCRNVLIPCAVLAAFLLLGVDPYVLKLCVIFSALPIPSLSAIYAGQEGRDGALAASAVFDSTIFSMISIPVWGLILEKLT